MRALINLGRTAVPEIERAFDSIQQSGVDSEFSENAGSLFVAYATILGRNAVPRLTEVAEAPKTAFLRLSLDDAIALSNGVTSYISASRPSGKVAHCRSQQPRDALNQLISSWLQDNRPAFEDSLGATAMDSVRSLLSGGRWESFRQELLRNDGKQTAVGYKLDAPEGWWEPEALLPSAATLRMSEGLIHPELKTFFSDKWGRGCGAMTVHFTGTLTGTAVAVGPAFGSVPLAPDTYLVDEPNMKEVLRIISACASVQ